MLDNLEGSGAVAKDLPADDVPPLQPDVLFHFIGFALWGTLAGFAALLIA